MGGHSRAQDRSLWERIGETYEGRNPPPRSPETKALPTHTSVTPPERLTLSFQTQLGMQLFPNAY